MFITVNTKQKEKPELLKMKDVSQGYLVKTGDEVYAITGNGGTALLLNFSDDNPWFTLADGYLDEPVEVIGEITRINFEIE